MSAIATAARIVREAAREMRKTELAARLASSGFFAPTHREAMTAPPVARALKILMKRMKIMSTRETPETEASPRDETMTESMIPMRMERNCSAMRGRMRAKRVRFENRTEKDCSTSCSPKVFFIIAIMKWSAGIAGIRPKAGIQTGGLFSAIL